MAVRKAVSKRTRFEVFKRDCFACQYCGAHPPDVLLQVDHVIAVASGGSNAIANLVTACLPCNAGKGAVSLAQVPQSLTGRAEELREREAQILGYQSLLAAIAERIEAEVDRVAGVFRRFNPTWTLSDTARVSVRRFIERLGVYQVADAMEIACSRVHDDRRQFKYFCGICWSKIRESNDK